MVRTVNREENDVSVKFMKPHAPAATFYWPVREDVCEVPFTRVIAKLEPPACTSRSGRHYAITEDELKKTEEKFNFIMSQN